MVASDRVSAFDRVLEPEIPGKGEALCRVTRWWLGELREFENHLLSPGAHVVGTASEVALPTVPAAVEQRALLCRRLTMIPAEFVVRGYLAGSGWKEYRQSGAVCGIPLPAGLRPGDKLPEPIFTPARKAQVGEHDENVSFEQLAGLIGTDTAEAARSLALAIYHLAAERAVARDLILADTKFEFGYEPAGTNMGAAVGRDGESIRGRVPRLVIADEVLTSDSSRYWDAHAWHTETEPARRMASFDKQPVRDWIAAQWDGQGDPPTLPPEVVAATAARYQALADRLTG